MGRPASSDHLEDLSPEALLEAAAGGHATALLTLYDRVAPTLVGVAMRVLSNRAESEDVVQDAFTRAWREAASFDRQRGSALAWMVTLTRNRAIDVLRQRKRRAQQSDELVAEGEQQEPERPRSPERALHDMQRAVAVRAALDALRPEQRAALELAYFSGLSHSEIAAALGQPLGTVKTRIAQSVKRLREVLAAHAPAPDDDLVEEEC